MTKLKYYSLFLFCLASSANAISLKGNYPICISKNAYERLSAMAEHNDIEAIEKILKTECFTPKEGIKVDKVDKVVSRESGGVVQIKIYYKGGLYDFWTSKYNLSAN